ncbi:MAG: hypothetical protein ACE5JZ_12360 [Kiloniellales bacterium]
MRRARPLTILIAVALAAPLLLAGPVRADSRSFEDQVEDKLRQGAEKIIEALEILLRSIPTYGPPRIDEDGNIIIPRRGGPLDKTPEDEPDDQPEDVPPEAIAT